MTKHEIVNSATEEQLDILAEKMSYEDKRTVSTVAQTSPRYALQASVDNSEEVAVWLADGEPMAIFGIAKPNSLMAGYYYGWIYVNEEMARKYAKIFYWGSKIWAIAAKGKYKEVRAHCDSRNKNSLKWLNKIGFKTFGSTRMGPENTMFYRLRIE